MATSMENDNVDVDHRNDGQVLPVVANLIRQIN